MSVPFWAKRPNYGAEIGDFKQFPTPRIQLQIFKKIKNAGTILHFVGDLNQSIYEFKKVDPQKVAFFTTEEKFEELPLKGNFRSCQPIVNICQKLVGDENGVLGNEKQIIEYPCIYIVYKEDQMKELPNWFTNYVEQCSLSLNESVIITRNWNNVSRMRPSGNNYINKY